MSSNPANKKLATKIKDLELKLAAYEKGAAPQRISEEFRRLANRSRDGIYQYDLTTRQFLFINNMFLEYYGIDAEGGREVTAKSVLNSFCPEDLDKVKKARDESLAPGSTGGEAEYRQIRSDGSLHWMHDRWIIITDETGKPVIIEGIVRDNTEHKRTEEDLKESVEHLRRAIHTTIQVLVLAVETKDPYTAGHQKRTANLARAMAAEMNLPPEKIEGLRMAGVIHDIGKISIPSEILSKPKKLPAMEYSLIKEHARHGYEILKDVESPWPLADIVYQHHERIDGSGYPRGLKGEEILIEARILAVADVVEAMASHRPYRPALGMGAALEEIEKNRGILYDPAAVETCLRLIREKGFQLEADANHTVKT